MNSLGVVGPLAMTLPMDLALGHVSQTVETFICYRRSIEFPLSHTVPHR